MTQKPYKKPAVRHPGSKRKNRWSPNVSRVLSGAGTYAVQRAKGLITTPWWTDRKILSNEIAHTAIPLVLRQIWKKKLFVFVEASANSQWRCRWLIIIMKRKWISGWTREKKKRLIREQTEQKHKPSINISTQKLI